MLGRTRRIHFVGIGGIGMSGIAELLANLGYEVSGSDARRSTVTDRLEQLGVRVSVGHDAAHVGRADVVVVTSAIKSGNPETIEAVRRQIPVIPRAEMLAELMRLRYGIAIAGAHGKTSTTSMVALVLERAGLDPTAVIGGRLSAFGSNARLGRGEYMVVEADESDRSFLKLSPSIAVITNIDHEHMESYGSWADLQQAFVEFANKVPFYGAVIACADDEPVRNVLPRITRRLITYGLATADGQASASVTAHGMTLEAFGSRATVRYWTPESGSSASRAGELDHAGHQGLDHGGHQDLDHGGHQDLDHGGHQDLDHGGHQDLDHGGHQDDVELGELRLQVPGRHNLLNALAAVAAGLEVGIPFETIAAALAEFQGAERRFQRLGEEDGVMVVDDYGHHPTEIAAVLAAARAGIDRRVIVVFQPHRYSRTSQLLHEFGAALSAADEVVLTDIYAAGEPPIPGVTLEALALVVRQAARGGVRVVPALEDLPAAVATMTRPGDLVITLGAGSIGGIGERILEAIRHRRAQPASAGRTR